MVQPLSEHSTGGGTVNCIIIRYTLYADTLRAVYYYMLPTCSTYSSASCRVEHEKNPVPQHWIGIPSKRGMQQKKSSFQLLLAAGET